MASVSFKDRVSIDDLAEAEAGLGRALGRGVDPPSGTASLLLRPLLRLFGRRTVTVNDEGITVQGTFRPWSEFGLAYETDGLVCVVVTQTTGPLTLHKRDMTEDQLAEVRRLIGEHVAAPSPETIAWIEHVRTSRP